MKEQTKTYCIAFLLMFVVGGTGLAHGDDIRPEILAGTKLLKEGDRLADDGQFQEAETLYEDAFEELLPSIRKLPFQSKVKRSVTKREDMKALLLKEFESDMTPEEFRANEMAMKAFGFIKPELDLKALLVQVYSEEIAAFYDPRTKTMHLIKEVDTKPKQQPSFFEQLFGKKSGFDKSEKKTVIAHELTHALADQHYNLDKLQEDVKHNDDRSLAVSALIEGEATLAMMGVGMDDWVGEQVIKMRSEDLDRTFSFMTPFMSFLGGGATLKTAPPIITESMLFPYIRGMIFCAKLANDGGWKGVDDAYRNPPLSTEQILHPSKFRHQPDYPMTIDLGDLSTPEGWKELGRNVVGEMQLAVLLRNDNGKAAAAGWDGDCYAVFEGPSDQLALVWLTTWDTEQEAAEFVAGYLNFQTRKLDKETPKPDPKALALTRLDGNRALALERRGSDVAIIEGFSAETTATLMDQIFKSSKTEQKGTMP